MSGPIEETPESSAESLEVMSTATEVAPPRPSASEMQTLFGEIYTSVLRTIRTRKISAADLVIVATSTMSIVQRYPRLSGQQKKQLVVEVLTKVVDDSDLLPADQEQAALMFIQFTLPPMIDVVVDAYRHNGIDLKKSVNSCFPCLGGKK